MLQSEGETEVEPSLLQHTCNTVLVETVNQWQMHTSISLALENIHKIIGVRKWMGLSEQA